MDLPVVQPIFEAYVRDLGLEGSVDLVGDRLRLEVEEGSLGQVVTAIESAGGRVLGVQPVRRTLEDYFFEELGGARSATPASGAGAWGEG